ncbi:hypothetical protein LOT_0591 [Lentilactobacillus otakiensis DSM 19908 = JCM 15040]|uniref:Uncharacterized protein n=1 Tax=Lentilactobacillus otakiensis DSM 19908 = JCM 15040 TaxID=1423780 RepID=S4NPT1_9LACO|nr:hypothetical protein LOT_0591 [Lentilactobacillus otakiensis DSM 19908 = JCM 15040]
MQGTREEQHFKSFFKQKNGKQLRPSERLRADRYLLTVVWHQKEL